jgi:radical SAM superfamily enzyme YgiQ (UPF0313 family)
MKILLAAVNAKYIHSNLAVYSLRANAAGFKENIRIAEYTINNLPEEIIKGIYKEQPDVVAFSCYIWNISLIRQIICDIRRLIPEVKIWFGGPEVSYNPEECLKECRELNGIIIGEGEKPFRELVQYYIRGREHIDSDDSEGLKHIRGLAFKKSACIRFEEADKDEVTVTMPGEPLNMDELVFPYEDLEAFRNKIIYYESSRGCPFNCSYCLSSLDKTVRFRSLEHVKADLKAFLDSQVKQVKFVDRTFNCNKGHSIEIIRFIKDNDNGITGFHFEAAADLFDREAIELLSGLRPGLVQLEIGVQSINPDTIAAINRRMDLNRLSKNVKAIGNGHNIHQHLDLIAGLPYEDFDSFSKSFDFVYRLSPNQLQLGFLKVLKGSPMEEESKRWGLVYSSTPPYEILCSRWLSYDELLRLKGVSAMVETYYNSGQFIYSMKYLENIFKSPMELYLSLSDYYEEHGLDVISHNRFKRYEILMDFYREIVIVRKEPENGTGLFGEILFLDMCLMERVGNRPDYAPEQLDYARVKSIRQELKLDKRLSAVELFNYNVFELITDDISAGKRNADNQPVFNLSSDLSSVRLPVKEPVLVCFDYSVRDPINNHARIIIHKQDKWEY